MAAEVNAPNPVSSNDRLGFTLFLALAAHALIIFGVTFSLDKSNQTPPTLEVTLATHKNQQPPDKADFLAQYDQAASGTGEKALELTTERDAEFFDSQIRDTNLRPQLKALTARKQQQQEQVTTTGDSPFKVVKQVQEKDSESQQEQAGEMVENTRLSEEIASLQAKVDKQRQSIAKWPRVLRMTSVSTKAAADAEYLNKWARKVEFVGNNNFPKEALNQKIFGTLRMTTVLNANGTIKEIQISQSSGFRVLDDAALQIIHLASPFAPFPPEIRKDWDEMEITRTWHFEITGLSTSANNLADRRR